VAAVRMDDTSRATRQHARHLAAWRATFALPAIAGSFGLLLLFFGWMGRWEALALLGWLAPTVGVQTQAGERIAVHLGCGFRRPTALQAAMLLPLWWRALDRCAVDPRDVDLYLRNTDESNAFAAGKRSVALTTGTLSDHQAGRLADEHVVAMLIHELGHHATRGTRFALVTTWLAAPWRFATRTLFGIVVALGRRQRLGPMATVLAGGVVVAVIQSAHAGHWAVAAVLIFVSTATLLCPAADSSISRRCELAADQYAAEAGVGADLTSALRILGTNGPRQQRLASRLLSRHPATVRRIRALAGASN
jgi:STE24 endopeptidase